MNRGFKAGQGICRRSDAAGWLQVFGCAVLLAAGCSPSGGKTDARALTATVTRGGLVVTVKGSGDIRSVNENKIMSQLSRNGELEYIIKEGVTVTNGQELARFNPDAVAQEIMKIEDQLAEQESKLESVKTALEIQKMDNAKDLKTAEQAVRAAQLELEKLIKGDGPLSDRQAELKVQTTARELAMVSNRVTEMEGLLSQGYVTADQLEEDRIALQKSEVAAETARVELDILRGYTAPMKETKAEDALAAAETELKKTRKNSEARLRQKHQDVRSAERSITRTRSRLELEQAQLAACRIFSPADGVVTYGSSSQPWRRRDILVGARISTGQVLMTIPSMDAMKAVIMVPEADVFKVREGQAVQVTIEAAEAGLVTGAVERVADVANSAGWYSPDVKEFEVEVTLQEGLVLKPGYSCTAEIETGRLQDVLLVPVAALFYDEEGSPYVYRAGAGRGDKTPVTTGAASETHVQIVDGLAEGDEVLLTAPEVTAR